MMFDYPKWRSWLREKAVTLEADGFVTRFAAGPDDGPKPGMILEALGKRVMGCFENWVTGETDYTILAIHAPPMAKPLFHRWGLVATDETFDALFGEFVARLRQFESDRISN